jgi:hypothetical protein
LEPSVPEDRISDPPPPAIKPPTKVKALYSPEVDVEDDVRAGDMFKELEVGMIDNP